jgi:2-polyprenyl-6-hydroxyphenyl methylase/3-demethylubiquinone-9 3-methyltransferase
MHKALTTNSVDPNEIAVFTKDAAFWWDEDGPFKPLHQINPVRLAFIRDEIINHFKVPESSAHPLQNLVVLDIGCGGGLVCEPLARLGALVTGIDPGQENIKVARLHARKKNLKITYMATTAEKMVTQKQHYDVVIALEIVEHVADVGCFIQACSQLLKPNGILILSTLNRTLKSYALGIIAAEHILRWVPRGTHSWHKFLKPSELVLHLRANGITPKALKGMVFKPLTRQWTLSSDIAVNYLLSAHQR